jgi:hypothetical protein
LQTAAKYPKSASAVLAIPAIGAVDLAAKQVGIPERVRNIGVELAGLGGILRGSKIAKAMEPSVFRVASSLSGNPGGGLTNETYRQLAEIANGQTVPSFLSQQANSGVESVIAKAVASSPEIEKALTEKLSPEILATLTQTLKAQMPAELAEHITPEFVGKTLEFIKQSRPTRLARFMAPAFRFASTALAAQGPGDLAQLAEPNRRDIGFLGMTTNPMTPQEIAAGVEANKANQARAEQEYAAIVRKQVAPGPARTTDIELRPEAPVLPDALRERLLAEMRKRSGKK